VHSRLRQQDESAFGTQIRSGRNRYLWLGTHALYDAFTFAFEHTPAGWIWFHGYRYDADTSTVVVECTPQTWEGLGFADLDPAATTARLTTIFARQLDGHPLMERARDPQTTAWLNFTGITNERWSHGPVALMGDAAHTAHFSIGSGTTLALDDAIVLADALARHRDRDAALTAYRAVRLPGVIALQTEAANSQRWFETVDAAITPDRPLDFGYSLLRRRFADLSPGEHAPRWRYEMFRATQHQALRSMRFQLTAARRAVRARSR
jgi:2-polyprenyl-6-methoxyphenol hydroxylase-like FAD-dependent oxidoreductase